mmetsp:Transcript_3859/g.7100  ORF Transcript_3859/g.7100 Transcript_3859/m.7100 type:complete len:306 (-) Transcript_3859:136-1053(-)
MDKNKNENETDTLSSTSSSSMVTTPSVHLEVFGVVTKSVLQDMAHVGSPTDTDAELGPRPLTPPLPSTEQNRSEQLQEQQEQNASSTVQTKAESTSKECQQEEKKDIQSRAVVSFAAFDIPETIGIDNTRNELAWQRCAARWKASRNVPSKSIIKHASLLQEYEAMASSDNVDSITEKAIDGRNGVNAATNYPFSLGSFLQLQCPILGGAAVDIKTTDSSISISSASDNASDEECDREPTTNKKEDTNWLFSFLSPFKNEVEDNDTLSSASTLSSTDDYVDRITDVQNSTPVTRESLRQLPPFIS